MTQANTTSASRPLPATSLGLLWLLLISVAMLWFTGARLVEWFFLDTWRLGDVSLRVLPPLFALLLVNYALAGTTLRITREGARYWSLFRGRCAMRWNEVTRVEIVDFPGMVVDFAYYVFHSSNARMPMGMLWFAHRKDLNHELETLLPDGIVIKSREGARHRNWFGRLDAGLTGLLTVVAIVGLALLMLSPLFANSPARGAIDLACLIAGVAVMLRDFVAWIQVR